MTFCKFRETVAVNTFFLEINILRANLGNVRVIVTKIIQELQLTSKIFLSGGRENDLVLLDLF